MDSELKTTFLPSEVARLVLGYLKDQRCARSAECFLRDSIHLGEYRSMLDQGFTAPLTIGGRNLVEVLCHCQIYTAPASQIKETLELWDKLDHIVVQLKSFNATVGGPQSDSSAMPDAIVANTHNVKMVQKVRKKSTIRIRQSGAQFKQSERASPLHLPPEESEQSEPTAATADTAGAQQSEPTAVRADTALGTASAPPKTKKHVRWKLHAEAPAAASHIGGTENREQSYSDIEVTLKADLESVEQHADESPVKEGPSFASLKDRQGFPSAIGTSAAEFLANTHGVALPLSAAAGKRPTEADRDRKSSLTLPDDVQWDWSPYKQSLTSSVCPSATSTGTSSSGLQTPDKTELDQEVSDLLNQLFPMKNVVEKLVGEDGWAQGFADFINERMDSQSYLAEEKVPEIIDITKADPNFTEFHKILDNGKRRKGRPMKKPCARVGSIEPPSLHQTELALPTPQESAHTTQRVSESMQHAQPTPETEGTSHQVSESVHTSQCVEEAPHSSQPVPYAFNYEGQQAQSRGWGPPPARRNSAWQVRGIKAKNLYTGINCVEAASQLQQGLMTGHETPPEAPSQLPSHPTTDDVVSQQTRGKRVRKSKTPKSSADERNNKTKPAVGGKPSSFTPHSLSSVTPSALSSFTPSALSSFTPSALSSSTRTVLPSVATLLPAYGGDNLYYVVSQGVTIPATQIVLQPQSPFVPVTSTDREDITNTALSTNITSCSTIPCSLSVPLSTPSKDVLGGLDIPTPSKDVPRDLDIPTPSKDVPRDLDIPTPSKDVPRSLDIEQTTALLFSAFSETSSAVSVAKKHPRKSFTPPVTSVSTNLLADMELRRSYSEGKVPPMAKDAASKGCIVTAKWSPSLKNLIDKISPRKPATKRRTTHIRHLSFSPKTSKVKKSRRPDSVPFDEETLPEKENELSSGSAVVEDYGRSPVPHSQSTPSPRRLSGRLTVRRLATSATLTTPPSVGGAAYAGSPMMTPPPPLSVGDTQSFRSPLSLGDAATPTSVAAVSRAGECEAYSASTASPTVINRSVTSTTQTSTGIGGGVPRRRTVPVARKGGTPQGVSCTPTKKGSPSIVLAGNRGSIASVTVAESTPKGKNSIPTAFADKELWQAVDAMMVQGSDETSSGDAPFPVLVCGDIVEASGKANRNDASSVAEASTVGVAERESLSSPSEDTVGVAEALMELAGSDVPAPMRTLSTTFGNTEPSTESLAPLSRQPTTNRKRKSNTETASPTTRSKQLKETPKKMNKLKKMSVQSMLDLIHQ